MEYAFFLHLESQMLKIRYFLSSIARYSYNHRYIHPHTGHNNHSQHNLHLRLLFCSDMHPMNSNVQHTCSRSQLVLQKLLEGKDAHCDAELCSWILFDHKFLMRIDLEMTAWIDMQDDVVDYHKNIQHFHKI